MTNTYKQIKNIFEDKEIYISDILELIKETKNDQASWKLYFEKNTSYNTNDVENFEEWFEWFCDEIPKTLKEYIDYGLIKYNFLDDILEVIKNYMSEDSSGSFSYDVELSDIDLLMKTCFDETNYCLFKYGK